MEVVLSHLAENLKRLRGVKGLTQDVLAQAAGISRNAYRSIEKGISEPRYKNLQRIAEALGVSVFQLMKVPPQVSSLRFRSNKTMSARDNYKRRQHIIDFARWLNDFNALEEQLDARQPFKLAPLVSSNSNSIRMAESARQLLGLNELEPIWDICSL